MLLLCECNNETYMLLNKNGFNGLYRPWTNYYSIDLKTRICKQITYPKERSRKPIIELTQESLDQMLLLDSLSMNNQEIIEVIKGESDV